MDTGSTLQKRTAQLMESGFTLLPDNEKVHAEWRRIVVMYSVVGVKVHDARLVAARPRRNEKRFAWLTTQAPTIVRTAVVVSTR